MRKVWSGSLPDTTKKPLPLTARSVTDVVNLKAPCSLTEWRMRVSTPPDTYSDPPELRISDVNSVEARL